MKNIFKKISKTTKIFIIGVLLVFIGLGVWAASPVVIDTFEDITKIAEKTQITVDTVAGQVKLTVLPPPPPPPPPLYLLFDTRISYTGNLGGRVGADIKCRDCLDRPAACVGDAWAFISVSAADEIRDMLTTKGINEMAPWYFRDSTHAGVPAALNWTDLLDASVINTPFLGGLDGCAGGSYWTGSSTAGGWSVHCSGWTSSRIDISGRPGAANHKDGAWLTYPAPLGGFGCGNARTILCACRAY